MAINYYAGRANDDGDRIEIVYHFDIAADPWTNAAGKTLKECLVEDPAAGPTKSIVVGLPQVEQDKLDARDLLECVERTAFGPEVTAMATRRAWVEGRARTMEGTLSQTLYSRYCVWGYAGTAT